MNEFEIIKKCFAELTGGNKAALGLTDDAALIESDRTSDFVVTKDVLCEGTHFLKGTDAKLIASKLLRVNLSDLVAKGAKPYGYFLGLSIPRDTSDVWFIRFAAGLGQDIKIFGGDVLGGDTTSLPPKSNIVVSLTAIGKITKGGMVKRSGANHGDYLYVTGTIGDAYLGLLLLQGKIKTSDKRAEKYLINRYNFPEPRVDFTENFNKIASAAIDVSDGLIADLQHICDVSKIAAEIDLNSIPLSKAARFVIDENKINVMDLLSGGDDYEILFAASDNEKITNATKIGQFIKGKPEVRVLSEGKRLKVAKNGYRHFC